MATVRTNITKSVDPDPKLTHTRGKVKKTYTPTSVETGSEAYGKSGKGTKVAKLLSDARSKKQDIAYDDEGKPYRAGVTTETSEPPRLSVQIDKPKIPTRKESIRITVPKKPEAVAAKKKPAKLKPMGMTYGTSGTNKGGTKYIKRVRK